MTSRKRDTSLGTGVYFAADDYVGFWRRILILVIDIAFILLVLSLLDMILLAIPAEQTSTTYNLPHIAIAWVYFTVIKASPVRTLGYRIARARIVDLRGQSPNLLRMTFRMLIIAFGPIGYTLDFLWGFTDEDHQMLHDRLTGTCLINNKAQPLGEGEIHLAIYTVLGMFLMYPHVIHPSTRQAATSNST